VNSVNTDQLDQEFAEAMTAELEAAGRRATDLAELLDLVRHSAVRLLSDVRHPPSALHVRAGQVSLDIEWAPEKQASAGAGTATPDPAIADRTGDSAAQPAHFLTAPTVGVFYQAPSPEAEPFVREGDQVTAGQQIAIIEAMKLMMPVSAERSGRILRVLKSNGDSVEYGEELFAIEPSDAS
jgi:acetyl-CoA carboxylase biotin carboxyl carrier protein